MRFPLIPEFFSLTLILCLGILIARTDLRNIAQDRLKDAEVLLQSRRYAGAVYLCGYVVEIALKARICRTLKWAGYPSTRAEFQNYQSFRTHNLDTLLSLSGTETKIKKAHLAEWSVVQSWDPKLRYSSVGNTLEQDALDMINSAKVILSGLR